MPSPREAVGSSTERLPTHRRRAKVAPERRKRVSTACNSCNVRRVKCSGEKPCSQCLKSGRDCVYPSIDEKITVSRAEFDELQAQCALLQQRLDEVVPDADSNGRVPSLVSPQPSAVGDEAMAGSTALTNDQDSPNEGRVLQDPDGTARYLGESSGAVFLDYLKEFMATMFPLAFNNSWPGLQNPETTFIASLGRYQTHDSRPLLVPEVDPLWFPSRTEASIMLVEFRYLAQDGNGDFPCGGIYFWGDMDELLRNASPGPDLRATHHLAILNAAFAVATQVDKSSNSDVETSYGNPYFARARSLLGNPLDRITIGDAAVLGLLAFYLMEMNRRDSAYMYVSIALHILIMHGVHRGWMVDEQGKRVFWTIYILERRLSILMGRPPLISDDSIKIKLPEDVFDCPPTAGLRAHIELSRISTYIVCNVYQIVTQGSYADRSNFVEKALRMLMEWRQSLPPALQTPENIRSTDRACIELHLAYNQLLILTIRPIYFVAVKKAVADRYINGKFEVQSHPHLPKFLECSAAARQNLNLGQRLSMLGRFPRLLHAGLHHVFNAAVILQLHQLLFDTREPMDESGIQFAIAAFENEARNANVYADDCTRVLLDLNSLVQRLRSQNLFSGQQPEISTAVNTVPNQGSPYSDIYTVVSTMQSSQTNHWSMQHAIPNAPMQMTVDEQDPSYQELITWLRVDDLQLYNT